MRILTEQELRRAVDGTVKRTLAENSQNEGLGWLLAAGAAGLLGVHFWPQIKKFFTGQDDSSNSGQTPSQGSVPSSGDTSGSTDSTLPPLSGSPSSGQLEDWQQEWRRSKGQGWEQGPDMFDKPSFDKAPPQARIDGQEQTRPGRDYREYSELDKVDALLNNPNVMSQLSSDDMRLLLMYRMMLSDNGSRSNTTYNGYARGHNTRSSRTTNSYPTYTQPGYARGHNPRNNRTIGGRNGRTPRPTNGNGRYAPGHGMN